MRMGRRARLSEVLWEPLAVAALNQSPDVAAAGAVRRGACARMFNGSRRDAAIGLPLKPLDQLYAEPARRWLEDAGHQLRIGAPARLLVEGARAVGVEIEASASSRGRRVVRAMVRVSGLRGVRSGACRSLGVRRRDARIADRHRQPLAGSPGHGRAVRRPAGAHVPVGLRQGAAVRRAPGRTCR